MAFGRRLFTKFLGGRIKKIALGISKKIYKITKNKSQNRENMLQYRHQIQLEGEFLWQHFMYPPSTSLVMVA